MVQAILNMGACLHDHCTKWLLELYPYACISHLLSGQGVDEVGCLRRCYWGGGTIYGVIALGSVHTRTDSLTFSLHGTSPDEMTACSHFVAVVQNDWRILGIGADDGKMGLIKQIIVIMTTFFYVKQALQVVRHIPNPPPWEPRELALPLPLR